MTPCSSNFLLIFFFFVISILLPSAYPLSFNLTTFDDTWIEIDGDASFFDQKIKLTKDSWAGNINGSTGRVLYKKPFILWDSKSQKLADFMTHFSFFIMSLNYPDQGDGLAFFLIPHSNPSSPIPPNSGGSFLGLFNESKALNKSANQVVAVEFDTYPNSWDPRWNHVGINVNSIASVANDSWFANLKAGMTANATVSYNSTTKDLSVFMTYDNPTYGAALAANASVTYNVDLKEKLPREVAIGFSACTGSSVELHEIRYWDFSSSLEEESSSKSNVWLIVGVVVSVGVIMVVLCGVWCICRRNKVRRWAKEEESDVDDFMDEEFEKERGPKRYTFKELVAATNNFSEGKLGQGGFGDVYKGFLNHEEVAIKRVSAGSKQGKKEYVSEVKIISRLRHRNLVQLVGWSHKQGELLLVYKFMPNRSLDYHLYNQEKVLVWPVRYNIAMGIASALLYLHEEWEQCVVHRDVKPSNVMLDSEFVAKLGDFGLARLVDHEIGSQTTILAGTMGYLAPEGFTTGKARKESDVYSFGIVALEISCGKRPVEFGKITLVQEVWELYGRRAILEAADKRLKADFDENEMEHLMVVGLWCAHPDHVLRPSIKQAISVLKFEAPLPNLPPTMPVPMFVSSSSTASLNSGYNDFTTSTTQSSGSSSTSLLKSYRAET